MTTLLSAAHVAAELAAGGRPLAYLRRAAVLVQRVILLPDDDERVLPAHPPPAQTPLNSQEKGTLHLHDETECLGIPEKERHALNALASIKAASVQHGSERPAGRGGCDAVGSPRDAGRADANISE